jgi:hypothetical protein
MFAKFSKIPADLWEVTELYCLNLLVSLSLSRTPDTVAVSSERGMSFLHAMLQHVLVPLALLLTIDGGKTHACMDVLAASC